MILWRAGLRYLLRHPLQLLFAVIGVALGVGVVVAIDLANSSANKAFSLSAEAVSGRTSHQLIGGPAGLSEEVYRRIRLRAYPLRQCSGYRRTGHRSPQAGVDLAYSWS